MFMPHRRSNENTRMLAEFYARATNGERVVIATMNGEIASPAVVAELRKEAEAGRKLAEAVDAMHYDLPQFPSPRDTMREIEFGMGRDAGILDVCREWEKQGMAALSEYRDLTKSL